MKILLKDYIKSGMDLLKDLKNTLVKSDLH